MTGCNAFGIVLVLRHTVARASVIFHFFKCLEFKVSDDPVLAQMASMDLEHTYTSPEFPDQTAMRGT